MWEAIMGKMTIDALASAYSAAPRLGHPLEAIKFFRRFKPSVTRDLIYTLLWNTAIGLVFTVLALPFDGQAPLLRLLWVNFVIANCIGYGIYFRFMVCNGTLGGALRRQSRAVRMLYYSIIELAGVFGGYWLGFTLLGWQTALHWLFSATGVITVLLLTPILSGILAMILYSRERRVRAEADFQRKRTRAKRASGSTPANIA
jgi:Na+-driven multidrug efflux pump